LTLWFVALVSKLPLIQGSSTSGLRPSTWYRGSAYDDQECRWVTLAAQRETGPSPLKRSLTMRDDQWQRVTDHSSYHEGYKRLLPYASPHGLGRIACLDHCFAIGILRFAGYLAALLFENQRDQCQSSQG
jgi:hypothetical protein